MRTIDVDQHLFEERDTWARHIDPAHEDDALAIVDDENGWPWVSFRGERLFLAEIQRPGEANEIGDARLSMQRGEKAPGSYEDRVPEIYTSAAARLRLLDEHAIDEAVLFPNFGLVWEGRLAEEPAACRANLRAYNRWLTDNVAGGEGRLFGVAQVTLDDLDWLAEELTSLGASGTKLAMIAPAPVHGKPLSDPMFDPAWRAFCDAGITPVFHVAGFKSPLDPAWLQYEPAEGDRFFDSVFLHTAPAIAIADLIVHGVFDRFSDLHIAVVELTAGWVPTFLLALDGAFDFYTQRHGAPHYVLERRPSEYFRDHVRVSALPYENPSRLAHQAGAEVFMIGSDWPHAEGVRDPGESARRAVASLPENEQEMILSSNAAALLHA